MSTVTININGMDYNLKGRESEEYLVEIAKYVNEKVKDIMEETDFTKRMFGTLYVGWHVHLLVLSSPSETLAQIIKNYVDKNYNVGVSYKKFKDDEKNDIDIKMLFYIKCIILK